MKIEKKLGEERTIIDPECRDQPRGAGNMKGIGMKCISDCRLRGDYRGLSDDEREIAQEIYDQIPQYRSAARVLAKGAIYTRSAPHGGYKDLAPNTCTLYVWEDMQLDVIADGVSCHRGKVIKKNYPRYKRGEIDPVIWENYITGGYNTRYTGLRDVSAEKKERMRRIARSHADYMGSESGDSSYDHNQRVRMRNEKVLQG
jgi:hypothetical protein